MQKDKTGVQLNLGHTSTDDFITEKYVLPLLRDEKMRNKLIEEHRATPVGRAPQPHKGQPMVEHSKELQIVLDKLRRQPMHIKKYVTICKKDFEDYRIGIVTGVRGQPVEILEESFSSEEACFQKVKQNIGGSMRAVNREPFKKPLHESCPMRCT